MMKYNRLTGVSGIACIASSTVNLRFQRFKCSGKVMSESSQIAGHQRRSRNCVVGLTQVFEINW
jgi:hypothetical protein